VSSQYEDLSDAELLAKLDNHDGDLDSTGTRMLESMLKQVRGGHDRSPRALSPKQRAWAIRMIEQMDSRYGREN
jgi:hypothetical protein